MIEAEIYANDRAGYKTLVGKDGWLFIWDVNGLSEQVLGQTQLTVVDSQQYCDTILDRHDFCRNRGIDLIHMVVPDKSAVYPEMLPAGFERAPSTVLSETAKIAADFPGGVKYFDLTEWLIERKSHGEVFLKTDSHWTSPTALDAVDAVIKRTSLAGKLPSIGTGLRWEEKSKIFELAALLPDPYHETFQRPVIPEANSKIVFENAARGRGRTMVHTGPGSARILLFRDSFSSMFTNQLAEQCERLVTINTQIFWEEIVEVEKPDLVIFQTSERFLHPVLPDSRRRSVEETFGYTLEQLAETRPARTAA